MNINPPIEIPDLQSLVMKVMSMSSQIEREFADRQGGSYQLRILPYRTVDNKVDGAVITIVDISSRALGKAT
jgi:two-component system, chemotaxis family, CheB/CheR fusion protein